MNPNMVVAYELKGERVAVWKIEDSWIVTNTFTKKSLLCLSASQALDMMGMRCSSAVERRFVKSGVGGSIPSTAAKNRKERKNDERKGKRKFPSNAKIFDYCLEAINGNRILN